MLGIGKYVFNKTSKLRIVNGLFICYFYIVKSDYILNSEDSLTQLITSKNIYDWTNLLNYVRALPYGRNKNREDLSLVWKEQKGTCSSKHAFLKYVADLNTIPNIELILGLYKMNQDNTPKIGNVLVEQRLAYIPEAHCYLKIDGHRLDFTSEHSDFSKIKNDIILETSILPSQVSAYKVGFHKAYLKGWIKSENIPFSFDEIWKLREQCIENLSL